MADIIEIVADLSTTPADRNAVYVWRGGTGPRFGNLDSFQHRQKRTGYRPSDDWTHAIEAARDFADRNRLAHIYVGSECPHIHAGR